MSQGAGGGCYLVGYWISGGAGGALSNRIRDGVLASTSNYIKWRLELLHLTISNGDWNLEL